MSHALELSIKRIQSYLKRQGYKITRSVIKDTLLSICWSDNPTVEEEANVKEYLLSLNKDSLTGETEIDNTKNTLLPVDDKNNTVVDSTSIGDSDTTEDPWIETPTTSNGDVEETACIDPTDYLPDYNARQLVDKQLREAGIAVSVDDLNQIVDLIPVSDRETVESINEAINKYFERRYEANREQYYKVIENSKATSEKIFNQFSEEIKSKFEQFLHMDRGFFNIFLHELRNRNQELVKISKENKDRIVQMILLGAVISPVLFMFTTILIFSKGISNSDTIQIKNTSPEIEDRTTDRFFSVPRRYF